MHREQGMTHHVSRSCPHTSLEVVYVSLGVVHTYIYIYIYVCQWISNVPSLLQQLLQLQLQQLQLQLQLQLQQLVLLLISVLLVQLLIVSHGLSFWCSSGRRAMGIIKLEHMGAVAVTWGSWWSSPNTYLHLHSTHSATCQGIHCLHKLQRPKSCCNFHLLKVIFYLLRLS